MSCHLSFSSKLKLYFLFSKQKQIRNHAVQVLPGCKNTSNCFSIVSFFARTVFQKRYAAHIELTSAAALPKLVTCPQPALCASPRRRNAHGHVIRGILHGNLQGKCWTRIPRQAFLCELAQSKCTWTCHKRHFCADISLIAIFCNWE